MKSGIYASFRMNLKVAVAVLLSAVVLLGTAVGIHAAEKDSLQIPIVMYHSVRKDPARHGKYVISPEEFEQDLDYLISHGYTAVHVSDLIRYTEGGRLPEKPILLTFDDGHFDNYYYAYQIALEKQCKFIISPIGIQADKDTESGEENPNYSYLSWSRLREMSDSGLVEVQSHSYNLHSDSGDRFGIKQKTWEKREAYFTQVGKDLLLSREKILEGTGREATAFTYPFGAKGAMADELIQQVGFSASMTSEEKISSISRDKRSLYNLGRFVRPGGMDSKQFFEACMKLKSG